MLWSVPVCEAGASLEFDEDLLGKAAGLLLGKLAGVF